MAGAYETRVIDLERGSTGHLPGGACNHASEREDDRTCLSRIAFGSHETAAVDRRVPMVPIVALLLGLVVLIVVEALPHDTIGAVFAACLRGMALILLLGSSVLFLTRRKREMKRIALGQAQGPAGRPWAIGAIVAAFAAIWLIAGTASQAKVLAHRLSALARMQIIGRAMVTSAQRDGWFPQSLDLLVEEGHLPATALNCSARSSAGDEESACI